MLFVKKVPIVTEVSLSKGYAFMYENFIVSSQHKLFVLLEQTDSLIYALEFNFLVFKYGYPNDEVAHPLSKYGLGFYGLFHVANSPWVTELRKNNRQHPRHNDDSFDNLKHYIAKFKDVTIEVVCREMNEVQLTKLEFTKFIDEQISFLIK